MSDAEEQARARAKQTIIEVFYGAGCAHLLLKTNDYHDLIDDLTAALQARERAGKREGIRETWSKVQDMLIRKPLLMPLNSEGIAFNKALKDEIAKCQHAQEVGQPPDDQAKEEG